MTGTVLLAHMLGFSAQASGLLSAVAPDPASWVMPTNAVVAGKTIAEWSAEWWKWAYSVSTNRNPLFDTNGAAANNGQDGPVFFLAGVFGISSEQSRTFAVPEGKHLFFPLVNIGADNIDTVPPFTISELRDLIAGWVEDVTELELSIDGISVSNLFSRRVQSPVFSINHQTSDNVATWWAGHPITGLVDPMVSDGFWIMLEPLPPGRHVIIFGGTFGPPVNFTLKIVDTVIVVKQPRPYLYGPYASTNGQRITISAPLGKTNVIEASSNLTDWLPVSTNFVTVSPFDFVDLETNSLKHRFYRAVQAP